MFSSLDNNESDVIEVVSRGLTTIDPYYFFILAYLLSDPVPEGTPL